MHASAAPVVVSKRREKRSTTAHKQKLTGIKPPNNVTLYQFRND